jgi:hypothetical protein
MGIVMILIFSPLILLYNGLILQSFWEWFVTPLTHMNMPFGIAVGLSVFFMYLQRRMIQTKESTQTVMGAKGGLFLALIGMVVSTYFWFIGWIVHLFVAA